MSTNNSNNKIINDEEIEHIITSGRTSNENGSEVRRKRLKPTNPHIIKMEKQQASQECAVCENEKGELWREGIITSKDLPLWFNRYICGKCIKKNSSCADCVYSEDKDRAVLKFRKTESWETESWDTESRETEDCHEICDRCGKMTTYDDQVCDENWETCNGLQEFYCGDCREAREEPPCDDPECEADVCYNYHEALAQGCGWGV